jgi:iron complex outermembrane receptor protein
MTTRAMRFSSILVICLAALISVNPVYAQENDDLALEEIIVTAERKARNLQEVPISVSAFSAQEIENRQIKNTLDVIRNVPNLVGSNNVGLGSATSLFLRGVGQDESLSTMDPAVGTYIDGVYVARQVSNNAYLYDIERIEVLRGPQGTLYGRNTSGGAIMIITKKPDETFSADIEGGYGSYDSWLLRGKFNTPLSDTVYLSGSAFTAQRDEGFQKNITLGTRTFDAGSTGARLSLRMVPNDQFDMTINAEYTEQKDNGITGSNYLGPNADDLFVVQSGYEDPFNKIKQYSITANAIWTGENTTWTSITGYRDLDHDFDIDFSDNPVPAFVIDQDGTHKQFSQEIQVSGAKGKFDWVLGAFYMKETNDNVRYDKLFLFGGAVAADLVADFENDANSWAVFGQGAYQVNDKLRLVLGGRWSADHKTLTIQQSVDVGGGILFPLWGDADLDALGVDRSPTFDKFTPHLSAEYQFKDDFMGYVSYTEGFKSGGWNARATDLLDFVLIDPETAEAWEIGFKSEFANNRVRLNAAYFNNTYKDFIITALNPATGGFITINAAKANISGVEFELNAKATENLSVFANIGFMWNEYKDLDDNVTFDINNEIKRVPDVTGQIGFNYYVPLPNASVDSSLLITADYSHQAKYFAGVNNSPSELAEATNLIHASISYLHDARWSLTAVCSNCTDQEYHTSTLDFGVLGFATQFPGPRRVVSLRLKVMFD